MATLTIKNIPDNLYDTLKTIAEKHHRSLNSEVIYSLEQVVLSFRDVDEIAKEARSFRVKSSKMHLTQKQLNAAKNKGRP